MKLLLKSWASLLILLAINGTSKAAQVSFWFSGYINSVGVYSNGLPSNITEGTPFTGYLFYDTAQIASSNTNSSPAGDRANYYFDTTSAFKMQIQAGGHTFANANHPQGYSCGYVGIDDQFNNHDGFSVDTESSIIQLDGSDWLVGKEFGILSLYLGDSSKTAFSSATIPTSPPELASFPDTHAVWITGRYDDGHSTLFNVGGVITNITQIEQVFLNVRRIAPQTIQLAWPVVASGFQLQTRSDLNAGDWQDLVAPIVDNTTDHTVTLPATGDAAFFRLTK